MRFARDYFLSWQIVKCLGFSLGTNVKPDNPYLVGRGIPMRKLYVDFVLAKATLHTGAKINFLSRNSLEIDVKKC